MPWLLVGRSTLLLMKSVFSSTLVALGFAAVSIHAADVSGKVTLKGTPPPEKEIAPLMKDVNCGKSYTETPKTRHYVVGADSGLGNVFVYVKAGLEGKTFDVPAAKVVVDQVKCLYEPYMVGAQAKQIVTFKNSDAFMHNVNFAASTAGNKVFNFAQATAGITTDKSFDNPEVFAKVQCNVHPWMFGYIGVVSNPFHAVTAPDGSFTIKGLPAGKYTLGFKHLKAGEVTQEVEVKADTKVTAVLEVK